MKSPLQDIQGFNDKVVLHFPVDLNSRPEGVQYGYRLFYELLTQQKNTVMYLMENEDLYCSKEFYNSHKSISQSK